jgi:hypothetical protein
MNRTIVVNGIEPAPLSVRWPLGLNLDLKVTMLNQNGTPRDPSMTQFVMLPRSKGGVYPYDMTVHDQTNGIAAIEVPGLMLTDTSGYNLELYSRVPAPNPADPPWPTALIAKGTLVTEGSAYMQDGPMHMINVPVVTGPMGPQGEKGVRGSIWTTGNGDPQRTGDEIEGDMYLNELNGDVWRYSGASLMWVRGTF